MRWREKVASARGLRGRKYKTNLSILESNQAEIYRGNLISMIALQVQRSNGLLARYSMIEFCIVRISCCSMQLTIISTLVLVRAIVTFCECF